jgi:hypothetical protein
MNVILESQSGDALICIQEFLATPEGVPFSSKKSHTFRIGERVRYVSFRQNEHLKDSPAGWQAIFEAADGKRYAATQTYFVTEECWQGLKKFFARRLLREPKPRTTPKP